MWRERDLKGMPTQEAESTQKQHCMEQNHCLQLATMCRPEMHILGGDWETNSSAQLPNVVSVAWRAGGSPWSALRTKAQRR